MVQSLDATQFANSVHMFHTFWFYVESLPPTSPEILLRGRASNTTANYVYIRIFPDGSLDVYEVGGTVTVASCAAGTVVAGRWYKMQAYFRRNTITTQPIPNPPYDTDGMCEVFLDGVSIMLYQPTTASFVGSINNYQAPTRWVVWEIGYDRTDISGNWPTAIFFDDWNISQTGFEDTYSLAAGPVAFGSANTWNAVGAAGDSTPPVALGGQLSLGGGFIPQVRSIVSGAVMALEMQRFSEIGAVGSTVHTPRLWVSTSSGAWASIAVYVNGVSVWTTSAPATGALFFLDGVTLNATDLVEVRITKDATITGRTVSQLALYADFGSVSVPALSTDIRIEKLTVTPNNQWQYWIPTPFQPDIVFANPSAGGRAMQIATRRSLLSTMAAGGYEANMHQIPAILPSGFWLVSDQTAAQALASGVPVDLILIHDPSQRVFPEVLGPSYATLPAVSVTYPRLPYEREPISAITAELAMGTTMSTASQSTGWWIATDAHLDGWSTQLNANNPPIAVSGMYLNREVGGQVSAYNYMFGFGLNRSGFLADIMIGRDHYVGNGAASRVVTTAGQAVLAFVYPINASGTGTRNPYYRSSSMAALASRTFSSPSIVASGGLMGLGPGNVLVGASANVSGTAYEVLSFMEGFDPLVVPAHVTQLVIQTMVPDSAGCPEPEDGESFCGAVEDPIFFASWQPGDGTTRWHAETALDDDESYYGGWKDDRLLKVSEVRRSLSGNTHSIEVGNFDITLADEDYAIRTILATEPGKYWSQRPVELYAVTPTARAAGLPARKVATGFIDSDPVYDPEKEAMSVRLRMKDRLGISQGWTPFGQQMVPRRVINQITLPGALPAVVGQAAPLPYGILSSNVAPSGIAPVPVVGANPIYGAFTDGVRWYAGYGSLGDGVVSASGVSVFVGAGGALPLGVPGDEYFVQVYAVAADGRIADPFPYSPFDASVVVTPGNQTVDVAWSASPDAASYYVYLGTGEPGIRWSQWLQTGALSCSFNRGPSSGQPANYDNITIGARPAIDGQRWRYGIRSVVGSSRSEVAEGMWGITNVQLPNGRFRPLLPSWENVPSADSYELLRGSIGASTWDRRWIVPAGQFLPTLDFIYGTDDMRDTGVEYVGAESSRAAGAVICTYVGDEVLPDQQIWRRMLVAGCAVKGVTGWYFDPGGSGAVTIDEGDGTEILLPRADNGGSWPNFFLNKFRDVIGTDGVTRRYTFGYTRGVVGDLIASGTGKLSVNLEGIETFGTGHGTVITHLVDQFAHLLQNVVIVSGEGYTSGPWLPMPTLGPDGVCAISSEGFADLKAFRDEELFAQTGVAEFSGAGIVGAFGRAITVSEELKRWCTCGDMRIGINRHWQITLNALRGAGAVAGVTVQTDEYDIHDRSLKIEPKIAELANVFPYKYRRNYATDGWEVDNQTFINEDSIARWQTRQEREPLELHYLRNDTIARHAVGFYNFRSSDVRSYVTFEGSLCLLDPEFEVGSYIRLQHWRGVGPSGWAERPLWILSSTLIADTRRVRLTCLEVDFLVPWENP